MGSPSNCSCTLISRGSLLLLEYTYVVSVSIVNEKLSQLLRKLLFIFACL